MKNKKSNTLKKVDQLKIDSLGYKALILNNRQLCDIELILNGAFYPLNGFLNQGKFMIQFKKYAIKKWFTMADSNNVECII